MSELYSKVREDATSPTTAPAASARTAPSRRPSSSSPSSAMTSSGTSSSPRSRGRPRGRAPPRRRSPLRNPPVARRRERDHGVAPSAGERKTRRGKVKTFLVDYSKVVDSALFNLNVFQNSFLCRVTMSSTEMSVSTNMTTAKCMRHLDLHQDYRSRIFGEGRNFFLRRATPQSSAAGGRSTELPFDEAAPEVCTAEAHMSVAHVRQVGSLLRSLAAVVAPRDTTPTPSRSANPIIQLL